MNCASANTARVAQGLRRITYLIGWKSSVYTPYVYVVCLHRRR
jgi:hypothetical protein